MQTEQQAVTAPEAPEMPPQSDSTPIKMKQHGGKRSGAGRKPNLVKRMVGRLSLPARPKCWQASTWKPQLPKS